MFKIVQKLAPAPPTGLYSPVAPLTLTVNCTGTTQWFMNITILMDYIQVFKLSRNQNT